MKTPSRETSLSRQLCVVQALLHLCSPTTPHPHPSCPSTPRSLNPSPAVGMNSLLALLAGVGLPEMDQSLQIPTPQPSVSCWIWPWTCCPIRHWKTC